jgi:hypothetical protein
MFDVFWLEQSDIRFGIITITERDMWNFSGTFEAFKEFASVRGIFEQAYELTEQERWEEWDTFYGEAILAKGFYLLTSSGEKMTEFILYIHHEEAWGRLS